MYTVQTFLRIVSTGVLLVVFGCSDNVDQSSTREAQPQPHQTITLTQEQEKNVTIEVDSTHTMVLHDPLRVHGMLHVPPQFQFTVTAPFGGIVKNTAILPGTSVRKGQVLTTLQHPEFVKMQEEYLTVSAKLAYAEQELQRQEDLAKDTINARRTLQEATANAAVLRVRKHALAEQLSLIGITASTLTPASMTSTISLRAPFDGYVTKVYVNNGSALQPSDKVLELVDPSHLHVELVVFERDAWKVKVGQDIAFRLSGETADRFGHVHLVGTEIGDDRTVLVHAHLNEADPLLRPGTTLTATIETGDRSAEAVPTASVVKHDGKSWVFVSNGNRAFTMHEVHTGLENHGMVEIQNASDIRGKEIVTKGAYRLLGVLTNTGD